MGIFKYKKQYLTDKSITLEVFFKQKTLTKLAGLHTPVGELIFSRFRHFSNFGHLFLKPIYTRSIRIEHLVI